MSTKKKIDLNELFKKIGPANASPISQLMQQLEDDINKLAHKYLDDSEALARSMPEDACLDVSNVLIGRFRCLFVTAAARAEGPEGDLGGVSGPLHRSLSV